jgi:hypothetical protein
VSQTRTPRPDFFIVGAPKAGTTSLHDYLRQHPQIFMPAVKELNYFGSDRALRNTPRLTEAEYLRMFAKAPDGVRIGEASVSYLRSNLAAREIAAFSPGAQAIVMLRNPVEMMHAMHSELVFLGAEDLPDFSEAVAAEADRRHGRRIPAAVNSPRAVLYRDAATFSGQLERYFEALGRDRVHVIVFDDFQADTAAQVRDTFRFLGVDESFVPRMEIINPAKVPRLRVVQRLLQSPPGWLRGAARRVLPRTSRKRIYRGAQRLNARRRERAAMAPELRARLTAEFVPEVERLERLLGRDLSAWKAT